MSDDRYGMFEDVLVYCAADHVLPAPFLQKLSDMGFTSCLGIAASDGEDIMQEHIPGGQSTAELAEMLDLNKNLEFVFCFSKYPEDYDEEDDIQPYTILRNDESEALVVAFLSGDFSEWRDEEDQNSRSDAFFCAQTQLIPMMNKLFARAEENMDAFVEDLLTNPKTHRSIRSLYGEKGTIVLLTRNNKILMLSSEKDDEQNKFDWGWVTKNFEYNEQVYPEPAAEQPKKAKKTLLKRKEPAPAPVVPDPAPDAGKEKPSEGELVKEFTKTIAEAKTSTRIPAPLMIKKVTIPGHLNQQERKKWIRNQQRMSGISDFKNLPANWKNINFIELPVSQTALGDAAFRAAKAKEEKEGETKTGDTKVVATTPEGKEAVKKKKTLMAAKPTSTVGDSEKEAPTILPKETVEKLVKEFLPDMRAKMIDISNKEVFNPVHLNAELERDNPTFIEAIGLKDVRETLNWGPEDIEKMGDAKAIAYYAFDLQSALIEALKKLGDKSTGVDDKPAARTKAA